MMRHASKRELLREIRPRYTLGTRAAKQRLLDELPIGGLRLVATTGYHRKYALSLLNHPQPRLAPVRRSRRPKDDGRVIAALELVWQAAHGICGKRLAPGLGEYVAALERHGEWHLAAQTRAFLVGMSAATVDRLRRRPHGRRTTQPGPLLTASSPIRTFAQGDEQTPGCMAVELLAHGGPSAEGESLFRRNLIAIQTRCNEFAGLANRTPATVTAAAHGGRRRLPFRRLGLDCDKGAECSNGHLWRACAHQPITCTRARPPREVRGFAKNDQAHIAHKNWTPVRQFVGADRFEGQTACPALNALYGPLPLYSTFFQPGMGLVAKARHGARLKKPYAAAKTPYPRVLHAPASSEAVKTRLRSF